MILSEAEKNIYNIYLRNVRQGIGFRPRQDFSNFDSNMAAYLSKISTFLKRYPHINWNDYFEAFRAVHPKEKYPPLQHFISRVALKDYAIYQMQKEDRNPELQFEDIKNGIRFIGLFCLENNIDMDKYLTHKTGSMFSWMNHYREHRISAYCLMELGDVVSVLDSVPKDEAYLFATNLCDNIIAYKTRYLNSPIAQTYIKKITATVKEFVLRELTLR